ncbi:MAG: RNA 2',3'-cyclic phosphodiesterase [Acetobacteraceae bacterium]
MRLFVALDLPSVLRTRLSWMAGGLPGARWVPPENYHVTLRFIGELPGFRAEEVDHALAGLRAPGFSIQLAGVGTFEKGGKVNSLWIGVERNPQLDHLQSKVETALQRAGLDRERRRFAPHVTLARLDGVPEAKIAGWVQSHNLFRSEPVEVEHFTLFSSRLGKEQAVYAPEVEYPLMSFAGTDQRA